MIYSCCGGCCGGVVLPAPHAAAPNRAAVTIKIAAGARVTVDGKAIDFGGTEQTFRTPELDPARVYYYVIKASGKRDGKDVSAEKRVAVKVGADVVVDLREMKPWTPPKPPEEAALITVKLPEEAKLFVDGVECPLTSADRTFETPRLEKGRKYEYTMRAEVTVAGKPVSETRRLEIEAGKAFTVEFARLPVQTAGR